MKPGKILVEDDEGKVSMDRLSREAGPSQCPHPHKGSEPLPPLVLFPNTRWGACMAGQRGGPVMVKVAMSFLGAVPIVKKRTIGWQMETLGQSGESEGVTWNRRCGKEGERAERWFAK